MLTEKTTTAPPGAMTTSIVLVASILAGGGLGYVAPALGQALGNYLDYTLLCLITLLFFGVRFGALSQAASNLRFFAIVLLTNFGLIPLIGYGIASLVLMEHPLFMIGLMIYFLSPCTDWFLGFTRLSGGNVALGTALIPVNMVVQLLLYPLYLQAFTHNLVEVEAGVISNTLLSWFVAPLAVAAITHQVLRRLVSGHRFETILRVADQAVPWVIALLVLQIFAGNVSTILANSEVFGWVLLAVFIFFVSTYFVGEGVSRICRLQYPEHALLTMTTAARNAPLMLAVTMTALPGQPLIYAAIVIGMLVEFPHLTALRHLLLSSRRHHARRDCANIAKPNP